jgi:hypothetical protein
MFKLFFRIWSIPQAIRYVNTKSWWIACLATLPAIQVAQVQSPVPARPTNSVEKVALFLNPALGARSQALQLRLYTG